MTDSTPDTAPTAAQDRIHNSAASHARYGNCAPCSVDANRVTLCRVICKAVAEDKFSRAVCVKRQGHEGDHEASDGWGWT